MFFPRICCSRRKALYSVLMFLACFLILYSTASYAQPNGFLREIEYTGLRSDTITQYPIVKLYRFYLNPPDRLVGGSEYDAWPVKTEYHRLAVPFRRLISPDFTDQQKEDLTRYVWYWERCPPESWVVPGSPSAVRNCYAYALGLQGYWVESLEQYMHPTLGDYEQVVGRWRLFWPFWYFPWQTVTHVSHNARPGVVNALHLSLVVSHEGSANLENWLFRGKFGAAGVYPTGHWPIRFAYDDVAEDECWKKRPPPCCG